MVLAKHRESNLLGRTLRAGVAALAILAGSALPAGAAPPAYDSVYRHVGAVVLDIRVKDPDGVLDPAVALTMQQTVHDYLAHELGTVRPDIAILERDALPQQDGAASRLEFAIRISVRQDGRESGRPAVALVGIESVLRGVSTQAASLGIWRGIKTAVFERPNAREILNAVASEVKKQLRTDIVGAYERYPRDF